VPKPRRGSGSVACVGVSSCTLGADLHVVADGDPGNVQRDQAKVREAPVADADLGPVIDVERRPDFRALANGPEEFHEQPARLAPGARRRGVVGLHQVHRAQVLHCELGIIGDVEVTGDYPLALGTAVAVLERGIRGRDRPGVGPGKCGSSGVGRSHDQVVGLGDEQFAADAHQRSPDP
jgi:hypothetical protein